MAARKRLWPAKREAALAEVARLFLAGQSHAEIAVKLGVSRQQTSYDVRLLRRRWQAEALTDTAERIAVELAKIDLLESTYWEAWERSLKPRTKTTTDKTRPEGDVVTVTVEESTGNHAYLAGVMTCLERRAKLLGLDAAERVDLRVSGPTWVEVARRAANGDDSPGRLPRLFPTGNGA